MNRHEATKYCREQLDKYGLKQWGIRLTTNPHAPLGLCSHKDECLILNAHHIDTHPIPEIYDTVLHEIAHALVGAHHKHDGYWADKARELGCNPVPCANISLDPYIIDAIRSGATIEVTHETVQEEVLVPTIVETHKPTYRVTRLQERCPFCNKVAKEVEAKTVEVKDENKPDLRFIKLECGHTIVKPVKKATPFHNLVSNWWDKRVSTCKHEWGNELQDIGGVVIANQCKHCLEFKLHPFQIEGARFLEKGLAVNSGGAIFDEMGLGKTVQALAYLWSIKDNPEMWPVLMVVKSSIKFQWFKESLRWLGPQFTPQVIETSKDIPIPNFKIYIASYDLFVQSVKQGKGGKLIHKGFDIRRLEPCNIKNVIIDECQQIKNPDASRTQELRKIVKGKKLIALSGTPWKNRGNEYYTVLNMLAPMKFPTHIGFVNEWVYADSRGKLGGINNPEKFREYIKDIAIRREVHEVAKEMPSVNKTKLFTSLDQFTQGEVDKETEAFVKWYQDKVIGGEEDSQGTNILARLAKLRQLIGLAKIPITEAYIEDFLEESGKTKIAVGVHHVRVLEILYNNLRDKYEKDGYLVLKFESSMNSAERFQAQENFNRYDKVIAIMSILACGEGLNLPTCDTAIMHEREWNPANEEQFAPGRFRRITSKFKIVNVIYNLAANSVDEILDGINNRKEVWFHNAMNKGEMQQWSQGAFAQELANTIVRNFHKNRKVDTRQEVSA